MGHSRTVYKTVFQYQIEELNEWILGSKQVVLLLIHIKNIDTLELLKSELIFNHYIKNFIKPVGCVSSLNVQNIYNAIMKDLSICEES